MENFTILEQMIFKSAPYNDKEVCSIAIETSIHEIRKEWTLESIGHNTALKKKINTV